MLMRGQARLIEAVAAVAVMVITFAIIPMLFKSPLTPLRSQVQVDVGRFAYETLYLLISNPSFINAIQYGNWSSIHSLVSSIVGPGFNWVLAIEPLRSALSIRSYSVGSGYVALNITIFPNPSVYNGYAFIELSIPSLNLGLPLGYSINATYPMANVFFTTSNGQPVYWWLMYYDYLSGNALIWLKANSPSIVMYVSRNQDVPYDPLTQAYCQLPYCPPYGGVSTLTAYSLNLPISTFNNGQVVFGSGNTVTYWGFSQGNTYCTGSYTIGNPLVLEAPQGSSTSCQLLPLLSFPGTSITLIGQLMYSIPNSQFTISGGYMVTVSNGTYYSQYPLGFSITMTYAPSSETYEIALGPVSASYSAGYVYLFRLDSWPTVTVGECPGGFINYSITLNILVYDMMSGTLSQYSATYSSPCLQIRYTKSSYATVSLTSLNTALSAPSTSGINYAYSTTLRIYDVLVYSPVGTMATTPSFVNYAMLNNVIPPQYAYGVSSLHFTPTTGAYSVVMLPNGTYYLVFLELQELGGG